MRPSMVLAGVVVVALSAGVAVGTDNAAPVASAGLDQSVVQGGTVYLDAGGSVDPDGSIASYEWEIRTPSGTTIQPACAECPRTQFTPSEVGEYAVTVTVTDDAGATRSDTLYVTVDDYGMPGVTVDGAASVPVGATANYTVTTTSGDAAIQSVTLSRNGSREERRTDRTDSVTVSQSFSEPGTYRLRAAVRDANGYVNDTTLLVTVVNESDIVGVGAGNGSSGENGGDYEHCPNGGRPYTDGDGVVTGCITSQSNDYVMNGVVIDVNGEPGIQLHGETVMSASRYQELRPSPNQPPTLEVVQRASGKQEQQNQGESVDTGNSGNKKSGDNPGLEVDSGGHDSSSGITPPSKGESPKK